MNINKALEHFKWRFKNGWNPTKRDIEAYNSIIDYKELNESANLSQNESLAKLWIHQFILLNSSNLYDSKRAILVINEILSKSVYEWTKILNDNIFMCKLNVLFDYKDYLQAISDGNITKIQDLSDEIIKTKEKELIDAIATKPNIEDTIKFAESQITYVLNNFEK